MGETDASDIILHSQVTWQTPAYQNGLLNFHFGVIPPGSQYTQGAGTIDMRNLRIYATTTATVTLARDLTVQNDISCVSLIQTSDARIKENVTPACLDELQNIFDNVEVQNYTRTDLPGNRIGFIAQDIQSVIHVDSKCKNLVNPIYTDEAPLLGLDYARLGSTVLWAVCKKQQALIADLTSRITALETRNKRTAKK